MTLSPIHILVERAASGDVAAFQSIAASHQRRVRAIALGITGRVDASDDITQEVLLKAWSRLHTLEDPVAFDAWLGQITRNCAADWLRAHARHARNTQAMADQTLLDNAQHTPLDELCDAEKHELLEAGLRLLDEEDRLLYTLYYRQGESAPAVGQTLGIAPATVRKRLQRTRNRLQAGVASLLASLLLATRVEAVELDLPPRRSQVRWPFLVALGLSALFFGATTLGLPDPSRPIPGENSVVRATPSTPRSDAAPAQPVDPLSAKPVLVTLTGPGHLRSVGLRNLRFRPDFGLPSPPGTGLLAELYALENAERQDLEAADQAFQELPPMTREEKFAIFNKMVASGENIHQGRTLPSLAIREDGSPVAARALELLPSASAKERPLIERFILQQASRDRFPKDTDLDIAAGFLTHEDQALRTIAAQILGTSGMTGDGWLSATTQDALLEAIPHLELVQRLPLLETLHNHAMEAQDKGRIAHLRPMMLEANAACTPPRNVPSDLHPTMKAILECVDQDTFQMELASQIIDPELPATSWQEGLQHVVQRCHLGIDDEFLSDKTLSALAVATQGGWEWQQWRNPQPIPVDLGPDVIPGFGPKGTAFIQCIEGSLYEGPPPDIGTVVQLQVR